MDRDKTPPLAIFAKPPPEPTKHRLRVRLRQWSAVISLCDAAETRPVELRAALEEAVVDEPVLVELMLPGGLAARVAGVVSSCQGARAVITLNGMTRAFVHRLRALASPEEPLLASGSGTMKVDELAPSSLRRQIDLLASKMTPND